MADVRLDRDIAGVKAGFLQFVETVYADNTPLCRTLALGVAENPELLSLAAKARPGQYPPYILFAAVQYLLLADDSDPLADYFPTLRSTPLAPEGVLPAFVEFCGRHKGELSDLVSNGLVQTNEVGRTACLTPAFAYVAGLANEAPLYLIDIGAAAGLNLLFDRYFLDYGRLTWGDPTSRVRIPCQLADEQDPPLEGWQPNIAHRIGVDLNPIDVSSESEARWLKALVWPDRTERAEVLAHAMSVAAENKPEVVQGDATELIPGLLDDVPSGAAPCVYHSYALEYFPEVSRTEFRRRLDDFGARRDLYFVEMFGIGEGGNVRVTSWHAGVSAVVKLAQCQTHGQWMRWLV